MTKQLSPEAEKLRKAILGQYDFSDDPAGTAVLDSALCAWDLCRAAQEQIDLEGLTVAGDRGQTKAHPCAAILRDQRAQFFAGMKLLKLDLSAVEQGHQAGPGRPTDFELYKKRGGRA